MKITKEELEIERLVEELADKLDKMFKVNNEFISVLNDAINGHIERIGEG